MNYIAALRGRLAALRNHVPSGVQLRHAYYALWSKGVVAPLGTPPNSDALSNTLARLNAGMDVSLEYDSCATNADVLECFRLLLGRNPNRSEWPGHSAYAGTQLREVVKGYLDSPEFAQRKLTAPTTSTSVVVDLPGFKIYVDPEDLAIGSHIAASKSYEPHVTNVVQEHLKAGQTFLDIGANFGFFSFLAASIVGRTGRVISIEPNPRNIKHLHASRELNNFGQVQILQAAAADEWKTLFFNAVHSNGMVSNIEGTLPDLLARETTLALKVDDLAELIPSVDMIKIDVEGAEYLALKGAEKLIARCRPMILSEFNPEALPWISGVSGENYLEFLLGFGYRLHAIAPDKVIELGATVAPVIQHWRQSGVDHIDILAQPIFR